MSIINTNFKTVTATDTTTDTTSGVSDQTSYYADLQSRLEEALQELEQYKTEWSSSLDDETMAKMERLEVTMKAELASLQAYGEGGYAGGAAGSSAFALPADIPDGWSVPSGGPGETSRLRVTEEDASLYADVEGYAGTINFEDSQLNFSVQETDGKTVDKVDAYSRGKDLVLTLTYEDGTKKSYIVVDGSVRSEPIVIDASKLTHKITIDTSRALRIADGYHGHAYGTVTGFTIWGTNYDDTLYSSQGDDVVVGLAGNDVIDGGAGDDMLFGDDVYGTATTSATYAEDVNGFTPGDDTIRGGAGKDTVRGGGGIDTSYLSDQNESVADMGGRVIDDSSDLPDPDGSWLIHDENWSSTTEDGMVVLKHDGAKGGQIDIEMGDLDGYTMALADVDPDDGSSLIITFVGEKEQTIDGKTVMMPTTFKLKIEGFFNNTGGLSPMNPADCVITLNMFGSEQGDIIDFHKVMDGAMLTSQNVNLYGMGGNDYVLGAESAIVRDGIDTANWEHSTTRDRLNYWVDSDMFADAEQEDWQANVDSTNGQIVISDKDGDPTNNINPATGEPRPVTLVAPDGFDHGYVTVKDGKTYVILANGEGDTIVFRFDFAGLDYRHIYFQTAKTPTDSETSATRIDPIPLTPVMFGGSGDYDGDGNPDYGVLSGGEGQDVIFGSKDAYHDPEDGDFIIEGSFATPSAASYTGTGETGDTGDTADTGDTGDTGDAGGSGS